MKSCIRGERGPPRRGAAQERRGPARPGQDRDGGPPRPVPGDRPLGMGTLPHRRPSPCPGPGAGWSPRHSLSQAVASSRGCLQPRGAPMERGTLVTVGCHRVRQLRTTRHSWALPWLVEVMPNRCPTPCSSPPAPHSPESSTLRIPGQLSPWVFLSPSLVSLAQYSSRHPLL